MYLKSSFRSRLSIDNYAKGILQGDRVILSQAITLIESGLEEDKKIASALVDLILEKTGKSIRIGVTGVPGVGKSTFIESFGKYLIRLNKRVAVLTVDPTSPLTKGSILGDKTRMEELSKHPQAFVRPSSSGSTLGGVATKTRETILLCEAAGYDVIVVETVGVGQSEVSVRNMTDFFLLLMLAGAGDELQGIKKGIIEMADAIVITKADGDNVVKAKSAQAEYQQALHLINRAQSGWAPKVLTSSALTNDGIADVWKMMLHYTNTTLENNFFYHNRAHQNIAWFHDHFDFLLKSNLKSLPAVQESTKNLEDAIRNQQISPQTAASKLLEQIYNTIQHQK